MRAVKGFDPLFKKVCSCWWQVASLMYVKASEYAEESQGIGATRLEMEFLKPKSTELHTEETSGNENLWRVTKQC